VILNKSKATIDKLRRAFKSTRGNQQEKVCDRYDFLCWYWCVFKDLAIPNHTPRVLTVVGFGSSS
jgi:hypothetical protein